MSEYNHDTTAPGSQSNQPEGQSQPHGSSDSANAGAPSAADLHVATAESPEIPGSLSTRSSQKTATTRSSPSRFRANLELAGATVFVIGLIWLGAGLLLYTAGGWIAFLGLLLSSLVTLLTLIGVFWSVFLKSVLNFQKHRWRHANRRPVSLIASLVTCVIALLVFIGRFDPYHYVGWLVLDNHLYSNSDIHWREIVGNDNNTCTFPDKAFHVIAAEDKTHKSLFHTCIATDAVYDNFVYEVQMRFIQGDCGAVAFRADLAHNKQYFFRICQDQTYCLQRFDNFSGDIDSLIGCSSDSTIHSPIPQGKFGVTQPITIAVVARGINFELWVDHQPIDKAFDFSQQALLQGEIGLAAESFSSLKTEVVFNNVKVWVLKGG